MYRLGEKYDEMAKLAIDVLIDYEINSFPLDGKEICKKLGINLIPYSAYDYEIQQICRKRSEDGFCFYGIKGLTPIICYNDWFLSQLPESRIHSTIFHEIKHILCNDKDESDDDLAEYFSKYIRCPIPLLIYQNITDINYIISNFNISHEQSLYIMKNLENRRKKYGNKIFEYEKPLLRSILKDKYIEK